MATSKIMHGARAKVYLGETQVGVFTNVSYGAALDVQPAYILGAFAPVELTYTAAEPISISAAGWRVIDKGPYTAFGGNMPTIDKLLEATDMTFSIEDRQTGKIIMKVTGVRHAGFSTSIAPKSLEEISYNFIGLRLADESLPNGQGEREDAATLP